MIPTFQTAAKLKVSEPYHWGCGWPGAIVCKCIYDIVKGSLDVKSRHDLLVAKHNVFPMICRSRRSKSRLAKAAGSEPCGHKRNEKVHAVVARSRFPSQNLLNTPCLDHS